MAGISKIGNVFAVETAHTGYYFRIMPSGHLEHLYYGEPLVLCAEAEQAMAEKCEFLPGNTIEYSAGHKNLTLENVCLEMSSYGKGDIRDPFLLLKYEDGTTTSDFVFDSYEIREGKEELEGLPSAYCEGEDMQELIVCLREKAKGVRLELHYAAFPACDCMTKSVRLINDSEEELHILRIMSSQLDFQDQKYVMSTFHGAWAREMERNEHLLGQGRVVNSSYTGTSSSRSNPFLMLGRKTTDEESGECYGMNLVYSGNHYESADVNAFGKLRILQGISPENFDFRLKKEECFQAPEVVLTYSAEGYGRMSRNMHQFVREHIVRGVWKYKERPVLANSWEAAYFNINEKKLVKMAKRAKKLGVELFVVDDGWFGERNDDTSSLGDWYPNEKKLPGGLKGLSDRMKELGISLGIWIEPEMVNEKSTCFASHPEWAVRISGREQSLGRNQMLLNLTREDVRDYLVDAISRMLNSADISYVKWDMNRIFSDLPNQEFAHRYVLGLYDIMGRITKAFPEILFEGCAAGGNRFDLGMLCYMPQIWASDNTDAVCRCQIQTGYSYGYPMSVVSAHVSGCPNHQTLRSTPLETRFHVACFGILGYECNLLELSKEEQKIVADQIQFYKKHRKTLQYGTYYRLKEGKEYQWMTVSDDSSEAVGAYIQLCAQANTQYACFRTKGLENQKKYIFKNREMKFSVKEFGDLINTVTPFHVKKDSLTHNAIAKFVQLDGETETYLLTGSVLNHVGVRLAPAFSGTGYNEHVRFMKDYASRLYVMQEKKEV